MYMLRKLVHCISSFLINFAVASYEVLSNSSTLSFHAWLQDCIMTDLQESFTTSFLPRFCFCDSLSWIILSYFKSYIPTSGHHQVNSAQQMKQKTNQLLFFSARKSHVAKFRALTLLRLSFGRGIFISNNAPPSSQFGLLIFMLTDKTRSTGVVNINYM